MDATIASGAKTKHRPDAPVAGNSAFMLMLIAGPIARKIEAKHTRLGNKTRTLSI